jgi:hypothetical protein
MSAKIGKARRAAFLRALAVSGNVTLAAEEAGVSRSWVSLARRAEPGFDSACREALASARGRLGAGGSNRPPRGWGRKGGSELVVAGTGRGRVQLVRAGARRWTPRLEARWLEALGESCNVGVAAEAVGMTAASLEAHLRRWPDLRRRVKAVLEAARPGIDAAWAAAAAKREPAPELWWDCEWPELSVAEAIRLLRRRRGRR